MANVLQEFYIESAGKIVKLFLTSEEAIRAAKDEAFALNLMNRAKHAKQNKSQNFNEAIEQLLSPGPSFIESPANLEESDEFIWQNESQNFNEANEQESSLGPSSTKSSANSEESDKFIWQNESQNFNETNEQGSSPGPSFTKSSANSEESDKFIWPSKCVYLLLQIYEEQMTEFSSGTKRHSKIWDTIAKDMNKINQIAVTGTQCQSKMNGLKKTYKKVLDYNNISGNNRKSWPYFERMNEIFGKSEWANPKAIATEAGPLSLKDSIDKENKNNKENERPTKKLKTKKVLDEFITQMKQERQEKEKKKEERKLVILQELKDQKEKHHQEKMNIMRKFCEAVADKKLFD